MPDIIRRRAVLAGAALAAPALLATAAPAATPQAGRQAPGFYRLKLGAYEITVVNDGISRRPNPSEGFVRNADPVAVKAALEAEMLPVSHLDITFNITFVNTGSELILFDAGTGGLLTQTAGTMWDNMAAAGIGPAAVDRIVFTHFHADHISGLVDREGRGRFPNAELVVPEAEWTFWMGERAPERAATMVKGRFGAYPGERIRRIAAGAEVAPGIVALPTYGHTPGHTSYLVASGGASLLVLGDVTNHPAINLKHPGWHVVFDMDASEAEATRRALFDRAAAERMAIIGYHWPFPALGHVRKAGDAYALIPAPWTSAL